MQNWRICGKMEGSLKMFGLKFLFFCILFITKIIDFPEFAHISSLFFPKFHAFQNELKFLVFASLLAPFHPIRFDHFLAKCQSAKNI